MRDVLIRVARAARPPFNELTPDQARSAYEAGADVLEIPKTALARVEDFRLPARDGQQLEARLYAPSDKVLPTLLFFHGGGFTVGSIKSHDIFCRRLSQLAGCAVISLNYRLAPEYKFPTAVHDAWDAMLWLSVHAKSLGLDAARIAVGGDSAGGTLAAVCAILARDINFPLALQLLIYPGCAAHPDTASYKKFADGFILGKKQVNWFFNQYIPELQDRQDWRFAPLNAPDVEGVAPAWVGLAECDPLVDEGVMYADKLRAAGVWVDLEIYRGVTHEFIKMGRVIPEARQMHADAARALNEAFESS